MTLVLSPSSIRTGIARSPSTVPDWFDKAPKTEIHLHLEGAIPHEALWQLVQKYGGDPDLSSFEDLEKKFEYRDFPHFLDVWTWKNNFLREYEDFEFIAREVARDLLAQNIVYVEAHYSPSDFTRYGLKISQITEAIRAGLDSVEGIGVALIADLVRDYGAEGAARTLEEVRNLQPLGVIGIGLGGAEHNYPAELFTDSFRAAQKYGLRTTAHAGEGAGAESVHSALENLRVERIGHGVRAIEDERLVEKVADSRIPLEVCPISNVRTGVFESLAGHPIRELFDRGCLVTVNTDDPKMFGNSLAEEYRLLEQQCGFSRAEIRQLIFNGIAASWMPASQKQTMTREFADDPVWNAT